MDDWLSRTRERLENGSIDLEYALAGVEALEAAGVDTTGWRFDAPEPRRSVADDGRTWYSTAPPADAGWLEVSLVGAPEATFRVAL